MNTRKIGKKVTAGMLTGLLVCGYTLSFVSVVNAEGTTESSAQQNTTQNSQIEVEVLQTEQSIETPEEIQNSIPSTDGIEEQSTESIKDDESSQQTDDTTSRPAASEEVSTEAEASQDEEETYDLDHSQVVAQWNSYLDKSLELANELESKVPGTEFQAAYDIAYAEYSKCVDFNSLVITPGGSDQFYTRWLDNAKSARDKLQAVKDGIDAQQPSVPATGVTIGEIPTMKVGDKFIPNVTITPANSTDKPVFSIPESSVATVSTTGELTAAGAGTATYTVKVGNITETKTFTVEKATAPTEDVTYYVMYVDENGKEIAPTVTKTGKKWAATMEKAIEIPGYTLVSDSELTQTLGDGLIFKFEYKKNNVTPPVSQLNLDALKAAITAANPLKEADYTAESWKEFAEAKANAEATLSKAENQNTKAALAQAEVDAATKALTDAQSKLVKKSTGGNEGGNNGGNGNGSGNNGGGSTGGNGSGTGTNPGGNSGSGGNQSNGSATNSKDNTNSTNTASNDPKAQVYYGHKAEENTNTSAENGRSNPALNVAISIMAIGMSAVLWVRRKVFNVK